MAYSKEQLAKLVADAKERHEARQLAIKENSHNSGGLSMQAGSSTLIDASSFKPSLLNATKGGAGGGHGSTLATTNKVVASKLRSGGGTEFNNEQSAAIELAIRGASFCLIGAAGTGKTTVTQEIVQRLEQCNHVRPIVDGSKMLNAGTPGIVIVGFTNKAVNNIKKRLPKHMQSHCMTIHKLLEFAPVKFDETDEEGNISEKMQFMPMRNAAFPLPFISTVIVEEDSMVGVDLWSLVMDAMPYAKHTQFIRLGDLNQLPPVFGPSDLGFSLTKLQTIELTHVYRQALLSPIISLATAIRIDKQQIVPNKLAWHETDDMTVPSKLTETIVVDRGEHGKLTIKPWKQRVSGDTAISFMRSWLPKIIDSGDYDPEEDQILCPFNVSFGTLELNRIVADHIAKTNKLTVFEVIARYKSSFWAVGDRVLVDRHAAVITKIKPAIGYVGRQPLTPSTTLDRWGKDSANPQPKRTIHDTLAVLDKLETAEKGDDQGKLKASHEITVLIEDTGEIKVLDTAGDINGMLFAYALTVHKSQGSEWRKVFVFLHTTHSTMTSRELIYTAVTRAKEELYIICEGDGGGRPNTLRAAAGRPAIPGTTLAEKIEYFVQKMKEYKPSSTASY